jgi:redox-sensitive bicupin YhaK (pirin superfamily)
MMEVRKAEDRGMADHGWLKSAHSFSFAEYVDPKHTQFRNLRVINEDRVEAGMGFGTHGHRDMEIVSYVLDGELAHNDSLGNGSTIRPGDVQRMSAGTGVQHSEFNASAVNPVHFLQIWILPKFTGIKPGYEEKRFETADKRGRLRLIVSPDAAEGSVAINADARILAGLFDGDERAELAIAAGRHAYVQVASGSIVANDIELSAGDALKLSGEPALSLSRGRDAEVLVFDLP